MKALAALFADLESTPFGTASRLGNEIGGQPILRRTVDRVRRAQRPSSVCLICPPAQVAECHRLLDGVDVNIVADETGGSPYRRLIGVARKWSLDGWRGGLGGATSLDEYVNPAVLSGAAMAVGADTVWYAPAAAAAIDPGYIDRMLDHLRDHAGAYQFAFAPVPPGLCGTVISVALLDELAQQRTPPGWLLAYKPDAPQLDLAFKECCYPAPQPMRHAVGRLVADTQTGFETLRDLLADHQDPDAETAGRWLMRRMTGHVPPMPREIEIELTTDDALADTPLRPRGVAPKRGPMSIKRLTALAVELAQRDDSLVVLGGFGDPLLHPEFESACQVLREAGVYGLAVRTTGLRLNAEAIHAIVKHRVDVVSVLLDAWSSGLYAQINGIDALPMVLESIRSLDAARCDAAQVQPILAPTMIKAKQNIDELEVFFDGWIRQVGSASIEGYSHYAGQCVDHGIMDMSPPTRTPCRRIASRCIILADGTMPVCDQDFRGVTSVGSVFDSSIEALWRGETLRRLREDHAGGRYDTHTLCGRCREWHRP